MANSHRGEIEAILDGRPHRLCLTLGALADLESAFGDADMLALADRFGSGRLKASDAARLIGAGLRGGGHPLSDDIVTTMTAEGGAAGFIDIVVRLLAATFGPAVGPVATALAGTAEPIAPTDLRNSGPTPTAITTSALSRPNTPSPEEERTPVPFPGAR
jgi:Phage tail tube protein, GTA-gp10